MSRKDVTPAFSGLTAPLLLMLAVGGFAASLTVESGGSINIGAGEPAAPSTPTIDPDVDSQLKELKQKVATLTADQQTLQQEMAALRALLEHSVCNDAACGAELLAMGWKVLSDFGTLSPSRFGVPAISTKSELAASDWRQSYELSDSDTFTDKTGQPGLFSVVELYGASSNDWHMDIALPRGSTRVLIVWGTRGKYDCIVKIVDTDDKVVFQESFTGPGQPEGQAELPSGLPTTTTVSVVNLGSALASAPGKIRIHDDAIDVCALAYVLYQ